MTTKTYVGDLGTEVILDCDSDISAATAVSIQVRMPDLTEVVWNASIDGTNRVKHISDSSSFSQRGTYRLQAKVVFGANSWLGETTKLKVYDRFK